MNPATCTTHLAFDLTPALRFKQRLTLAERTLTALLTGRPILALLESDATPGADAEALERYRGIAEDPRVSQFLVQSALLGVTGVA